jgi:hypothetical protein
MQTILLLTLLLAPDYTRHRSSACTEAIHMRVEAKVSGNGVLSPQQDFRGNYRRIILVASLGKGGDLVLDI